ncbi:hypothetical protein [Rhodothermus bifroesti]|uniref:Outer membrane protein beta-barrel domain-containing protein n=1 Tax=Rhodothermus marinus TaxID=29549 RepID=A0A7V2F701_RHOMR|nr:hypothetical protein [Rhodothermus bifroesti]
MHRSVFLITFFLVSTVWAQPIPPDEGRFLQLGLAVAPGLGVQVGYVGPRSIYTIEGMSYADASPSFAGGEKSLQLSAAFGAALRLTGMLRTLGNAPLPYDLDIGLRAGPSLLFTSNETRAQKNQRFGLFLEPFFRAISAFGKRQFFFGEFGLHRPFLRAGLWFAF